MRPVAWEQQNSAACRMSSVGHCGAHATLVYRAAARAKGHSAYGAAVQRWQRRDDADKAGGRYVKTRAPFCSGCYRIGCHVDLGA